MGQGSSTNNKQQPQKSDSAEHVESVEQSEDDDISKTGSLKNKWLRQKPNDEKPKKNKKNDKKKKKKDDPEEVSSATCMTESDRTSLRLSKIELHLEECQTAPDEDDAISLSSCDEDTKKNLKDIESEEPSSFLNHDYSSSSNMTASPGESLSSGQDSGFARDNTIHSVSNEEEHTKKNQKNKNNSSATGTELITPTVKVTEKCKDYIEKSCSFNTCAPTDNLANSALEDETKKEPIEVQSKEELADGTEDSDLKQEDTSDTVVTSIVPNPKLETQSSITEIPKVVSQTEIMKDSDLVTGMVKELVDETLESAVEYLTQEFKRKNNKQEYDETKEQESIIFQDKEETLEKELTLSVISEPPNVEDKLKGMPEGYVSLSDALPEPIQDKVSEKEMVGDENIAALNSVNTGAKEITEEKAILINTEDSLNQTQEVEDISADTVSSTEPVNIDNAKIIEKDVEFQELSYSLKLKSLSLEENKMEGTEDKSEGDAAEEVVNLPNSDPNLTDYPLLPNEPKSVADNSLKAEISVNVCSSNSELAEEKCLETEILAENDQEMIITERPKGTLMVTDLDAKDKEVYNSNENLSDISLQAMTEPLQNLKDSSSFQKSTPESITMNESQDNCTDSSSGSRSSPQPSKDSKEKTEQSTSSETQPITDNTTGAVFV